MFGFNRKPKVVVQQSVRNVVRYESTPEDVARKERVEDYIKRATDEYARLCQELQEDRIRFQNGGPRIKDLVDRKLGKLQVLSESLAILKGTDHIIEVFQLDKQAEKRLGERFPVTSILSSSSPIFVD